MTGDTDRVHIAKVQAIRCVLIVMCAVYIGDGDDVALQQVRLCFLECVSGS